MRNAFGIPPSADCGYESMRGPRGPEDPGECMDIAVEELAGGVTKISLQGRFDTTGAVVVELPFNKIVTEKTRVIVDLSAVSFLASYAIRVLLVGAKIVGGKGGRLVILCPDNNVAKVLKTAKMDALIPIHQTESAATAALGS
jgi:anti-anti-sigma factor